MAKFRVELDDREWNQILNLLSAAAFRDVAPLINKIAPQLQQPPIPETGNGQTANPEAPRTGA